ncbi:hypothetical protein EV702DRAFT_1081916 [Suillus placidus]|uniref:Uncharacterized protein n=1 Tax=Suillus placidus TaxID=48579 RepID=A0A9P7A0S0_9AGAM|nr:hypothetical protein EV702DRAFT_1081916 [Suillus placidus]
MSLAKCMYVRACASYEVCRSVSHFTLLLATVNTTIAAALYINIRRVDAQCQVIVSIPQRFPDMYHPYSNPTSRICAVPL